MSADAVANTTDIRRVDEQPDEATARRFQLSLYNTLVILRAFVLGLPQPPGFEGAPMPGLVSVKSDSSEWLATGTAYVVIGLETTVGETGVGHVLRSGLAVLRLRSNGAYENVAFGTYDFTNIDAEKLSVIVTVEEPGVAAGHRVSEREPA